MKEIERDLARTRRRLALLPVLLLGLAAAPPAAEADDLLLVSRPTLLSEGPATGAKEASVSAGGRYVAFASGSDNLSAIDDDSVTNVFVRDTVTGTTTLVSRQSAADGGGPADQSSLSPAISADGRHVAFASGAKNLDPADTDGTTDIYVRDLVAQTTTLVSRRDAADGGGPANHVCADPSISADGRYVAFASLAANLSTDDDFASWDVFVRDTLTQTTTLVSRRSAADGGQGADGNSLGPSISGDGLRIAFRSHADNLSPDDNPGTADVFLRDRTTAVTELVSRPSGVAGGPDGGSTEAALSADGRHVAFASYADNLDAAANPAVQNVFVRDTATGVTTLVSRAGDADGGAGGDDTSGTPSGAADVHNLGISSDGGRIAFASEAGNLSADDGPGTDVFVRDVAAGTTTLVSRQAPDAGGAAGDGHSVRPAVSADARRVAFESDAANLSAIDDDTARDVFLRVIDAPAPPAGAAPPPPAPAPAAPVPPPPAAAAAPGPAPRHAAKLEVERARVERARRRLDVLAPITARASGALEVRFRAAGRTTTSEEEIDAGKRRVRFTRRITRAQARLGTGIVTLRYRGDTDTLPQTVRLRAASRKAELDARRPVLRDGRLQAEGTISERARGVVRVRIVYETVAGPVTHEYRARIREGRYRLNEKLPGDVVKAIASRRGVVHSSTLFTGYLRARMRGEMASHQILAAP